MKYDNQIINGNGTSPNVEGLIDQLNNPTNPGTIATFDLFVEGAMEGCDGLWAKTLRDVRMIVNPATYQLAGGKFRGTDGDMTALSHLTAQLGSFSTNSRMPAKSGNVAKAIIYRAGRPGLRTAVHPTWGEIAIDDIYTDAAFGQRSLHAERSGRFQIAARSTSGAYHPLEVAGGAKDKRYYTQ